MTQEFEQFARLFESTSPYAARLIRKTGQELFEKGDIGLSLPEEKMSQDESDQEIFYRHPRFYYYPDPGFLIVDNNFEHLHPPVNGILKTLCSHLGRIVRPQEMSERVWGYQYDNAVGYNIDINFYLLKEIFRKHKIDPNIIRKYPGLGFCFVDPNLTAVQIENDSPQNNYDYSLETRRIKLNGKSFQLSPTENLFVAALVNNPIPITSSDRIAGAIWHTKAGRAEKEAIRTIAFRLRSKIEPDKNGSNPQILIGSPNRGYLLRDPGPIREHVTGGNFSTSG